MVLMPTDAYLAWFLPYVTLGIAGSEIRPTSLRVSSWRTVGYEWPLHTCLRTSYEFLVTRDTSEVTWARVCLAHGP